MKIIDPRPSTNHKLENWFIISGDGVRPLVRTHIHTYVSTYKRIDQRVNYTIFQASASLAVDHSTTHVLIIKLFHENN